mmetsp:Transcript_30617/g.89047  ORF Transcript_30617/g.89047 Transcript_30617/m.89047 type:complete len:159 (+) Transcript_30617:198-674(+)
MVYSLCPEARLSAASTQTTQSQSAAAAGSSTRTASPSYSEKKAAKIENRNTDRKWQQVYAKLRERVADKAREEAAKVGVMMRQDLVEVLAKECEKRCMSALYQYEMSQKNPESAARYQRINETVWRIGMGVLLSIKRPNEFDWFAPSEREYLTIKVRR